MTTLLRKAKGGNVFTLMGSVLKLYPRTAGFLLLGSEGRSDGGVAWLDDWTKADGDLKFFPTLAAAKQASAADCLLSTAHR